jgi:hypothetical protein
MYTNIPTAEVRKIIKESRKRGNIKPTRYRIRTKLHTSQRAILRKNRTKD